MSKDFALGHPCPHLVLEEVVSLGSDRRSLVPKAPVASANVVRVLINDEAYVPPTGLHAQAQISGAFPGAFRVASCDRTFTVRGSTESATVTLPVGRVTADVVAGLLRNALSDVAVEVVRGHVVLTDAGAIGTASTLFVEGSAAASLGFTVQTGARGRQVYPGWRLASAPDRILGRYPQFVSQIKADPIFKLTYVAEPRYCPRCSATYVENDYRFDLQGEAVLVQDADLLYQAALKILLTQVRSNPYFPSYGSAIMSRIGAKAVGAVSSLIVADVQTALANLQAQQQAQARRQVLSAKERLYSVSSVRVTPNPTDPTVFALDVVVTNASNQPVALSVVFTVPGAVALTGSNGLSLGLDTTGLSADQIARLFQ